MRAPLSAPFFALFAAIALFPAAVNAASLNTEAMIGVTNDYNYLDSIGAGYQESPTGERVSVSESANYSGLNSSGDPSEMTFSGSASASAAYGNLKTSVSGLLLNAFYNEENAPYNLGDIDPNGVPTNFNVFADASYHDELTYSDTNGGVYVNFYFQVTGTFSGSNVLHSIDVGFGGDMDSLWLSSADGEIIGQTWVTKKFLITPGTPIEHWVGIRSQFLFRSEYEGEGTYEGAADFSSTVTLVGMNLYDENNQVIQGWSMTSESGTVYPMAPIPEPGTIALLGLGAAALVYARHRRSGHLT